jgi:uncharacterized protein YoxC
MIEFLTLLVAIIGVILVPLIKYVFDQNSNIVKLETKIQIFESFMDSYKSDIKLLFQKIDDLKDDIHLKAEDYVKNSECTYCKIT